MRRSRALSWLLGACLGLAATVARADLYKANEALASKDLAKAFELYRELAEIGHPQSQGNIAIMYANGEGVARDTLLAYAWALIARENGVESVGTIVGQVEPHMTEALRARIAPVLAKYGSAGLQERLLPEERPLVLDPDSPKCKLKTVADPDAFYPPDAKQKEISGAVIVEARVAPDGSMR